MEGVTLEYANIKKNPGMRSVAKLCLNSFWGKFVQRSNLPQTSVVKTHKDFIQLMSDPEKIVQHIIPATDDVMYVSWNYKEESVATSPCTNVAIAAYTTAQARLTLFEYLYKLDKRVLYYDTDLVIFVSSPNDEYEPHTGSLLGQLTDELEDYGVGSFIETFVSGGPKFYAYRVRTPQGTTHDTC